MNPTPKNYMEEIHQEAETMQKSMDMIFEARSKKDDVLVQEMSKKFNEAFLRMKKILEAAVNESEKDQSIEGERAQNIFKTALQNLFQDNPETEAVKLARVKAALEDLDKIKLPLTM